VKEDSIGRIFIVEKLFDPGLSCGLIVPQGGYFLFDGFNLS
jgi:hypothetical protein